MDFKRHHHLASWQAQQLHQQRMNEMRLGSAPIPHQHRWNISNQQGLAQVVQPPIEGRRDMQPCGDNTQPDLLVKVNGKTQAQVYHLNSRIIGPYLPRDWFLNGMVELQMEPSTFVAISNFAHSPADGLVLSNVWEGLSIYIYAQEIGSPQLAEGTRAALNRMGLFHMDTTTLEDFHVTLRAWVGLADLLLASIADSLLMRRRGN